VKGSSVPHGNTFSLRCRCSGARRTFTFNNPDRTKNIYNKNTTSIATSKRNKIIPFECKQAYLFPYLGIQTLFRCCSFNIEAIEGNVKKYAYILN